MPFVSVVIPAYNAGRYIEDTLNSVLSQTFKDRDIIIIDDGSTDNTLTLVQKYKELHPNAIKLIQQNNSGPAAARNAGIKSTTSKYISFLDSDDLWVPGKLESQIKFIESQPEQVGLVYSRVARFDNKGLWLSSINHKPHHYSGNIYKQLIKGNIITTQTVITKRICFDKVGLFDTSPDIIEDYDMWLRIAKYYHVAFMDELHALYREHELGRSKKFRWSLISLIAVLQKHYDLNIQDVELCGYIEKTKDELIMQLSKKCLKKGEVKLARELLDKLKHEEQPAIILILKLMTLVPGFVYRLLRNIKRKMNNPSPYAIEKSTEQFNEIMHPK
jgi:glycosyltransferase involved in cell wall biosynthesis